MANANVGEKIRPSAPIPPGSTLGAELRARQIPQGIFANWIGLEQGELTRIIRGNEPVTPALAQDLEKVLDIPASFWLRYEDAYRAGLDQKTVNGIAAPARVDRSLLGPSAGPQKRLHFSRLEIERIPESVRGVYSFWHEDSGVCIYVGMAEDQPLKERLKQHWRGSRNKTLALWLDAFGGRIVVSYIPVKECDKIPQIETAIIRLWKPIANPPKGE